MSEEAEVDTGTVTAEAGGVEAVANLNGGVNVEIDTTTTDVTPKDDLSPIDRVKEKYGNDIDKVAEAYQHAQKKISEGQYDAPDAPEKYEYNFEVEGLDAELISPDDPLLSKMTDVFREAKLPQDVADSLVNAYLEHEMSQQPDTAAEIASLGAKGNDMLERLTNFSTSNFEEADREVFDNMTVTADNVKMLHRMVEMMGEQNLAQGNQAALETKSAQEYIDEAFEYRSKQGDAIGWDKGVQDHYEGLLKKANAVKK